MGLHNRGRILYTGSQRLQLLSMLWGHVSFADSQNGGYQLPTLDETGETAVVPSEVSLLLGGNNGLCPCRCGQYSETSRKPLV
jgi:hypothetical protein